MLVQGSFGHCSQALIPQAALGCFARLGKRRRLQAKSDFSSQETTFGVGF